MTVTGNLRDVMKESISAATSYVRSRGVAFRRFGPERGHAARRGDQVHTAAHQVRCQCREAIVSALQPRILDRHVMAFDIALRRDRSHSGMSPRSLRWCGQSRTCRSCFFRFLGDLATPKPLNKMIIPANKNISEGNTVFCVHRA
jgi:hypothetical protein